MPWATDWWARHLKTKPIVKIECGQCRNLIGEVKRDGDQLVALRRMVYPEPTVPRPQIAAPNLTELDRRRTEHDTHVLRLGASTADGRPTEVMKQNRDVPDAVAPISMFSTYCCPTHGEIAVNAEHLEQFAAKTDDTRSRKYVIPHPQ
jgi:hypothetical protein